MPWGNGEGNPQPPHRAAPRRVTSRDQGVALQMACAWPAGPAGGLQQTGRRSDAAVWASASSTGAAPVPAAADERAPGRWVGSRARPPRGRGGAEGAGHRYRAPAPAHCLRIERRHPGGGEERPRQRPLQAQGLHPGQGEGARWGRREGRQPAHPLLGDTNGDGLPEPRTVLLDHLYSPYGVAHVGDTLYVADTDGYPTPAEARTAASMASASWARR